MTIWQVQECQFHNKYVIYMSSKHYEESGYGLNLDLLTILYWLLDSYLRRSALVKIGNNIRPICLMTVIDVKEVSVVVVGGHSPQSTDLEYM